MKRFYMETREARHLSETALPPATSMVGVREDPCSARIALYDEPAASPRTEDVSAPTPREFIEALASRCYLIAREAGGTLPYSVVREVVENLIHADFAEPVVSILDGGHTIRFTDQGPGFPDKVRAIQPGFSTASRDMKLIIKGVGSGLPVVHEWLTLSGGSLHIEDNLDGGSVVTVCSNRAKAGTAPSSVSREHLPASKSTHSLRLADRHKKVLSLALELGAVGPTVVSRELSVALSTAYRDLAFLESEDLISSDETGKRILTEKGVCVLDDLLANG